MSSSSRRVASSAHTVQGSAPQDRLPQGLAVLFAMAGPSAPNPHAPPPGRATVACRTAMATIGAGLASSTTSSPDAGLIRLCASFQDANARCHAAPDDGREWKLWLDRRWEFSAAIEPLTPCTEEGRRAKARVALVLLEEAVDITSEYERFILATLRDLVGSAAA